MKVRITILCENTAATSLPALGEHGFAAWIETKTGNYLFDTGQGLSIFHNAKCFKKDLTTIKGVFLSHGHYDHTGGLPKVLKQTRKVTVYAHSDIFGKKYALLKVNGKEDKKYIGMNYSRENLEAKGAQFIFLSSFTEVEKGIYLTGEVPRTTDFEKADPRLRINHGGDLVPDPLHDDQSLVLETKQGLIVVLGCTHSGLINTLQHIMNYFPSRKLHTIVGGTHLGFLKDDQLAQTIENLALYNFEQIGASHCTGLHAAARLFQKFNDRFFFANVGTSIAIK